MGNRRDLAKGFGATELAPWMAFRATEEVKRALAGRKASLPHPGWRAFASLIAAQTRAGVIGMSM